MSWGSGLVFRGCGRGTARGWEESTQEAKGERTQEGSKVEEGKNLGFVGTPPGGGPREPAEASGEEVSKQAPPPPPSFCVTLRQSWLAFGASVSLFVKGHNKEDNSMLKAWPREALQKCCLSLQLRL